MPQKLNTWIFVLAMASGVAVAGGQDAEAGRVAAPPSQPLLLDRPPLPVTPPTESAARKPRPPKPELKPIAAERCTLRAGTDAGWHVADFADSDDSIRVLPCKLLEEMIALAGDTPGRTFRIWGETTRYQNRLYILPSRLSVEDLDRPALPEPAVQAPAPAQDEQPQTQPAPQDEALAIAQRLLSGRRARPVMPESDAADDAPASRQDRVIDRLVRVLPESTGDWWTARFESDNTLDEPPLRLLPCEMLEQAQKLTRQYGLRGVKMRISGEITTFQGRQYLLLRKVLRERDLNRF